MNNLIKPLKGYQSETPEANLPGASVAMDGIIVNLIDFQQFDYISYHRMATSSSRVKRYAGNSLMTVAQHCCRGAEAFLLMGDIEKAWIFMHHEFTENIGFSDIPGPVKALLGEYLKKYENELELRVCKHLNIQYPFPPEIKIMDKSLAQDEMSMMAHNLEFDYWSEEKSYNSFMNMINKLELYKKKYL